MSYAAVAPRGAGRVAVAALLEAAQAAGWILEIIVAHLFPENKASRTLMTKVDLCEVGLCRGHGKLDGVWRDCVIVERLLGEAAE